MKTPTWTDPIVDELHRIRAEIYEETGQDFEKFIEYVRAQESEREAQQYKRS